MKTLRPTFEQEQIYWLFRELRKTLAQEKELRGGLAKALDLLVEACRFEDGLFSTNHSLYDRIMAERPRLRKILETPKITARVKEGG